MSFIRYRRVGLEGHRPSHPRCCIRYAFAHERVAAFRSTGFLDVDLVKQQSGQHFVPIIASGGLTP
jgi:hypothetical protein